MRENTSATPSSSESPSPHPLAHQVGGHAGVQTSEDGSLLIKSALPLEHQFYADIGADPSFAALRRWVPRFLGTLRLEGQQSESGEVLLGFDGIKESEKVLENLSHTFKWPNILDIKLGTVLYDEDASPEKRARMDETARETTSAEAGIRLTGFQVYDNATAQPLVTPKSYGKSISVADLPTGIARFFPVCADPGAGIPSLGLPAQTLLPILDLIRDDVRAIRATLGAIEMRMVGASLLVVYEGQTERAAGNIEWLKENPMWFEEEEIEEGDDEVEEDSDEVEEDSNAVDGAEADVDSLDSEEYEPRPPCVVRLIDFAHTRLKPGLGPDTSVLRGIDTVLALLDGRIEEVRLQV